MTQEPCVAFVGAGASAIPPSRVPTWTGFNDILLECLCERLAEYSNKRQPTAEMLAAFRQRRDQTRYFGPDFQAQLMEEELGADYFRVWQSIDTDQYGPVHAGLADLAARGRIAAIITTNFDRLLELALRARDVPYEVFFDETTFGTLALPDAAVPPASIPVIKIHGTIENLNSLVDTLRQRVAGRPASLNTALQRLLRQYRWVYLGFSGADFSYDPHYLGILNAATDAKGFVFVARAGTAVQEGVRTLAESYGSAKATIVEGDLTTWLSANLNADQSISAPGDLTGAEDATVRVKDRTRAWVADIGPMAIVNIVYSMLKSCGMEADAFWLMRRTWKSYRSGKDTEGRSYARYNYNYGLSLLEAGLIRNPVPLAEDMSNLIEWKTAADENAFEYLGRSYNLAKFPAAGAAVAAVLAYRGQVAEAIAVAHDVTEEALAQDTPLEYCDVAIACSGLYDIVRLFQPAAAQLFKCVGIAQRVGDEPRRAMLSAQLGRFLTYSHYFDDAHQLIAQAEQISEKLGLLGAHLASRAARGRWLLESGTSASEATRALRALRDTIHELDDEPLVTKIDASAADADPIVLKGHRPLLCRVLLDLNLAALHAGETDLINQTLDELDELITLYVGYCPHYYLAYADCLDTRGEKERALAVELMRRAADVSQKSGNMSLAEMARLAENQIQVT